MFEIGRKKCDGELSDVGDDKAVTAIAPTDDRISVAVFHHIVTFFQERRHRNGTRTVLVRFHHRNRNRNRNCNKHKTRLGKGELNEMKFPWAFFYVLSQHFPTFFFFRGFRILPKPQIFYFILNKEYSYAYLF